jgi:hypothetical protein
LLGAIRPRGQARHSLELLPDSLMKRPLSHSQHTVAPDTSEVRPGRQSTHDRVGVSGEGYVPGTQSSHASCPADGATRPGGQERQAPDATRGWYSPALHWRLHTQSHTTEKTERAKVLSWVKWKAKPKWKLCILFEKTQARVYQAAERAVANVPGAQS